MVVNGQLEAPFATVEMQFEVGDVRFREKFIVMTNPTSPLIGLLSLQRNSTVLDMRHGILNFPFFSLQLKKEDRTYPTVIEPIPSPLETILQPGKRTKSWVKSQICTDSKATGIIQHSPLLETRKIFSSAQHSLLPRECITECISSVKLIISFASGESVVLNL